MAEIFDHSDYRAFLRVSQRKHPVTGRAITLESWVKRLGYKSPRSVAMVLKGQRPPSSDLIEAFAKDLNLDVVRKRYFELLVLKDKHSEEGLQIDSLYLELKELNPKALSRKTLDESRLTPLASWHNLVVRQMVAAPGFREDAEWISKRLRGKVSPEAVQHGIALMLRNGYLVRTREGLLKLPGADALESPTDIPSRDIRRHHAGMMQRAVEALVEQDVEARFFSAVTLRVSPEKFMDARKAVQEFCKSFNAKYSDEGADRVYQLSMQFFEHTTPTDG
jgi:uncharacterized protein (TIGR02147 family)